MSYTAYLVHRRAVASFRPITNGRLALALDPPAQREVTVSRQKARRFREWIGVEVREGVVSASEMYSP